MIYVIKNLQDIVQSLSNKVQAQEKVIERLQAQVTNLRGGWTDVEVKKAELPFPMVGAYFYRITSQGAIVKEVWRNTEKQRGCMKFLGVYRTPEEAEEMVNRLLLLK